MQQGHHHARDEQQQQFQSAPRVTIAHIPARFSLPVQERGRGGNANTHTKPGECPSCTGESTTLSKKTPTKSVGRYSANIVEFIFGVRYETDHFVICLSGGVYIRDATSTMVRVLHPSGRVSFIGTGASLRGLARYTATRS